MTTAVSGDGTVATLCATMSPGRQGRDLLFNFHAATLSPSSPGLTGRSSIPETAVVEPRSRGVLDAPHEAGHDSGGGMCVRLLAACITRGFNFVVPHREEGAGNAGCALHPRSRVQVCAKKAHTSIQVQRRQSGIPCAMALRLMPCSPRRRIRLVTVAAGLRLKRSGWIASATDNLAPATGVGTTRFCRTRIASFVLRAVNRSRIEDPPGDHLARRRCRVHRIPSRVRDDGQRPSCRERTGRTGRTDLPDAESEIFFQKRLDRFSLRPLICPSGAFSLSLSLFLGARREKLAVFPRRRSKNISGKREFLPGNRDHFIRTSLDARC
jgi:hypothetical protein